MSKLLLGILDKGTLRLGDNSIVNFEKSLIFFTSNLGAREMLKEISPALGFQSPNPKSRIDLTSKLESIALGAVRKRFSPEFVNRIDAVVTYQPLDSESLEMILDRDIQALQEHVNSRLADHCFTSQVLPAARKILLERGASEEYGARELKRTVHRQLTQPLATMVARGEILPGSLIQVSMTDDGETLTIVATGTVAHVSPRPAILIVDDNHDLLMFLATELKEAGWQMLIAENATDAGKQFEEVRPGTVLIDYMLGDDDGLKLAVEFQAQLPGVRLIMMTGGGCPRRNSAFVGKGTSPSSSSHSSPVTF